MQAWSRWHAAWPAGTPGTTRSGGAATLIRLESSAAAEKSVGRRDSSCAPFKIERHRSALGQKRIVLHTDHFVRCHSKGQFAERPPVEPSPPADLDLFHCAHAGDVLYGRLEFGTLKWRAKREIVGREKSRLRTDAAAAKQRDQYSSLHVSRERTGKHADRDLQVESGVDRFENEGWPPGLAKSVNLILQFRKLVRGHGECALGIGLSKATPPPTLPPKSASAP